MEYTYDIRQFKWDNANSAFYAYAQNLVATLDDGTFHPTAFPSERKKFTIKNYETENFRKFTYVETELDYFDLDSEEFEGRSETWVFESEDGIKCYITVS